MSFLRLNKTLKSRPAQKKLANLAAISSCTKCISQKTTEIPINGYLKCAITISWQLEILNK